MIIDIDDNYLIFILLLYYLSNYLFKYISNGATTQLRAKLVAYSKSYL